jgi:hypothetical protein
MNKQKTKECKLVTTTIENSMEAQQTKNRFARRISNRIPRNIPEST